MEDSEAFEGDELNDGGQFSSFQNVVINNDGVVAFSASTGQLESCSNATSALWKSVTGVIQPPVCIDAVIITAIHTILNSNGDMAFVPWQAIDSESGGRHRVMSTTSPVPGLPDERFDQYFAPGMNDNGELNFYGSTDITNTNGLWAEFDGAGSLESLEPGLKVTPPFYAAGLCARK